MDISPYSIYVGHRPFRVAFLLDPAANELWFDTIFEYNRGRWGGRFNPIILTDGKTIEADWWKFLRDYDPDVIISTVPISDDLRKRIHVFLTPLSLQVLPADQLHVYVDPDPASILPTKKNILLVAQDFLGQESTLALFEFDETTPEIIKKFIGRNFGLLEHGRMMPLHLKRALESSTTKIYKITDLSSLNDALMDIGEFRNRVIFPAQICGLPNSLREAEYNQDTERFVIVIGDSPDDLAYAWNRTLSMSAWLRTGMPQIWLPRELAESVVIKPGLGKFINKCTGRVGNNNQQRAHFVTFSLTEADITSIRDSFRGTIFHPQTIARYTAPQIPGVRPEVLSFALRSGLELYRAHSYEEHLIIHDPDVEEGGMGGQYWFIDLFIQFQSEIFSHIVGRDYWWQLPRRNRLASDLHIFNKPARINSRGMFSVLMRRNSFVNRDESTLIMNLPEERHVFQSLFCGESFACYSQDGRERFLSRPFYNVGRSDKGMYLAGVLKLFPSLWNASHYLEERYWREVFEKMANRNLDKDAAKKDEVLNILKKSIGRGRDFKNSDGDLSWLAEKVLTLAKGYVQKEVDLTFRKLKEAAEEESRQYNTGNPGNQIPFDEAGLRRSISTLINWNVFLMGIKPRCPSCGYRIWYHVDETKQQMACKGCGSIFTLDAEEPWHYRLNSLINAAFSLHGTVPILMILSQMLTFDAHTSFLYIPSVDLYKKDEGSDEEKLYGELDLACISDGKFIIGEIKQTVGLFEAGDFEKMYEIATLLKPDVIIFSSLDKEPSGFVKNQIIELQKKLNDLEITVQWYSIHAWVFDHKPVR
jgi:hypothetical protein